MTSREDAGMAVYCEQDIHATDIRGGPVLVTHRDDAIGSSRRTVCWKKYECHLEKEKVTAAESIDKRAKEKCNVCNNDAH